MNLGAIVLADGSETYLMLMDTEREEAIGLGKDYPFGPQAAGECIVSNHYEYTSPKV